MTPTISTQNTKMGKVHNLSLPPIISCQKDVPCSQKCYAMKAFKQYPGTRKAWRNNWDYWRHDAMAFFEAISLYCIKHKVQRFRWHVGGDIPNKAYYNGMVLVAECNPDVHFLAFTKNAEVIPLKRPENLKLVWSLWPGYTPCTGCGESKEALRIALRAIGHYAPIAWYLPSDWAEVPTEYREIWTNEAHAETMSCSGQCDQCFMCWYLEPGMAVAFKEH